jgi:hypothetical protein
MHVVTTCTPWPGASSDTTSGGGVVRIAAINVVLRGVAARAAGGAAGDVADADADAAADAAAAAAADDTASLSVYGAVQDKDLVNEVNCGELSVLW